MRQLILKYKIFLLLILCLLFSVKTLSAQITDTIVAIKQLQYNAAKALEREDFLEAVKNLNDANKLAMLPKYRSFRPEVELSTAELYYNLEYYDKATEIAEQAIKNAQTYKNDYKLAKAYNLYAIIQIATRNYSESELYLEKADSLNKLSDNPNSDTNTIYGYGLLAFQRGDYETAITNFKTAISDYQQQEMLYREATVYSNLADALTLIN